MNKDGFWALINKVNTEAKNAGHAEVLDLTEKMLLELPSSEIADWHSIQKEYANMAYRNDLWAACSAITGRCSDDGFIDFRSWLISRGHDVYMDALQSPDSLAKYDFSFSEVEFENYGYVAAYAYAKKVLIEAGGPESVEQQYQLWWSENAEKITAQFEPKGLPEAEQRQYLDRWFRTYLTIQHDVYKAAEKNPLSKECLASIRLEQSTKPDIGSNWMMDDLPEIVPELYAKYNSPDMMTVYSVHVF